eukprot:TRINITY_DN13819_c3_g2_i2.p3 TRINITY_DN13819_c3_g2~~TRINITY_DN13819_c3_g2_i2.p3  ORF type:complete len:159 (-),score=19.56 TRINITY_DN13819_c3_g2_i2:221-697(-)
MYTVSNTGCTRILADTVAVLAHIGDGYNEEINQTYDKVQVPAVQHGKEVEILIRRTQNADDYSPIIFLPRCLIRGSRRGYQWSDQTIAVISLVISHILGCTDVGRVFAQSHQDMGGDMAVKHKSRVGLSLFKQCSSQVVNVQFEGSGQFGWLVGWQAG